MKVKHILFKSIAVFIFTAMLFACDGNLDEVKQMNNELSGPQSTTKDINLFYTDSGKVQANLKSPKMLDFSNETFPYREFPIGVEVDFFKKDSTKNTIISDYAIIYTLTDIIDLRGNVKIVTADSAVLNSQQLYWDESEGWLFTDQPYTIQMPNGAVNDGESFDANQNFDTFNSRTNTGIQYIDEK
ncbi:LPS export ABC transporter periplasmic protein LptC [Psychroflexus salis]|uniref:LPS export ABC transporter periplasmic protein LptC n=1 Tax=Psychroflexus salis TaxID=1526574 RepID=A0A917E8L0_9FLAO|nr:LPS export ABC transporter periplasmic protein LptC [Psychroflexus salis]GGE13927.1 LPS export ABC transporter periplasmic protein LptC [Psychroflexus salis]